MDADSSLLSRLRRLFGLTSLVAMVGGLVLSSAGTARYEWTILTWLGYPEYNMPTFLGGMLGLAGLVLYGYVISREDA